MVTLEPINVPWSFTTIWSLMTITKLRYGYTRTHQRQYRWFNVFKFKWSKVTTRWSYRDSDTLASDDSNNAVDQVNHVGGVTSWILYSYRQENSAFNRQSTMAWSHMSNVTWPSMAIFMAIFLQTVPHDPSKLSWSIIGPNFKMVRYGRDGLNNDSTNVRNEHLYKPSQTQS